MCAWRRLLLLCVLSSRPSAASTATRTPQVVRLRDAATQQQIRLVGTVHYNPASIARSKEEVNAALGADQKLGAVVVESCASRWTRSMELAPPGSFVAKSIRSEMQGAAGVAVKNNVPVMLGDSDVGPFLERVRALAKQSLRDLADPVRGWRAIFDDFARTLPGTLDTSDVANSALLLEGEAPISLLDFLRPDVMLGFVASLVRYPAAFAIKAPIPFAIFASGVYALSATADNLDAALDASVTSGDVVSFTVAAALSFAAVEFALTVMLARVLLVAFLEERNAELARSIRRAAVEQNGQVVAILGGLHVNGVARLLMSTETPDADGRDADGVWWDVPADLKADDWVD